VAVGAHDTLHPTHRVVKQLKRKPQSEININQETNEGFWEEAKDSCSSIPRHVDNSRN